MPLKLSKELPEIMRKEEHREREGERETQNGSMRLRWRKRKGTASTKRHKSEDERVIAEKFRMGNEKLRIGKIGKMKNQEGRREGHVDRLR